MACTHLGVHVLPSPAAHIRTPPTTQRPRANVPTRGTGRGARSDDAARVWVSAMQPILTACLYRTFVLAITERMSDHVASQAIDYTDLTTTARLLRRQTQGTSDVS